ncbi:MAG: Methylmalonyl-CoA epimerase @ Ethylmalonyl-CoA epimerase, partial [uncultured Nocardioidaceae bacterium]
DRPRPPADRDRPRRHRRAGPRRRHRLLRSHVRPEGGAPGGERGAGRTGGDARRRRLGQLDPAARPAVGRLDDRQVPGAARSGDPAAGLPGSRPGRRHRGPAQSRRPAALPAGPSRYVGQPGELRPPQGRRRRAGGAGRAGHPL